MEIYTSLLSDKMASFEESKEKPIVRTHYNLATLNGFHLQLVDGKKFPTSEEENKRQATIDHFKKILDYKYNHHEGIMNFFSAIQGNKKYLTLDTIKKTLDFAQEQNPNITTDPYQKLVKETKEMLLSQGRSFETMKMQPVIRKVSSDGKSSLEIVTDRQSTPAENQATLTDFKSNLQKKYSNNLVEIFFDFFQKGKDHLTLNVITKTLLFAEIRDQQIQKVLLRLLTNQESILPLQTEQNSLEAHRNNTIKFLEDFDQLATTLTPVLVANMLSELFLPKSKTSLEVALGLPICLFAFHYVIKQKLQNLQRTSLRDWSKNPVLFDQNLARLAEFKLENKELPSTMLKRIAKDYVNAQKEYEKIVSQYTFSAEIDEANKKASALLEGIHSALEEISQHVSDDPSKKIQCSIIENTISEMPLLTFTSTDEKEIHELLQIKEEIINTALNRLNSLEPEDEQLKVYIHSSLREYLELQKIISKYFLVQLDKREKSIETILNQKLSAIIFIKLCMEAGIKLPDLSTQVTPNNPDEYLELLAEKAQVDTTEETSYDLSNKISMILDPYMDYYH